MFSGWLEYLPEVTALLIVLAGWLLGRAASHAVSVGLPWINRISIRWGAQPGDLLTPAFTKGLQILVFWGILLTSVIIGLQLIGEGELTGWLDGLSGFAPQLLITLGILVLGHVLGLMARSLVSGQAGSPGGRVLPSAAYGVVITVAVVTAFKHLGLDLTFITQIMLVITSVFFAGLALAFALGAKTLVANLVAQGELQRYKAGDLLLIDGIEGTVQEVHRTGLVLSTEQGLASIPAARFAEAIVIKQHTDPSEDG
jgi:hypothetical protein